MTAADADKPLYHPLSLLLAVLLTDALDERTDAASIRKLPDKRNVKHLYGQVLYWCGIVRYGHLLPLANGAFACDGIEPCRHHGIAPLVLLQYIIYFHGTGALRKPTICPAT